MEVTISLDEVDWRHLEPLDGTVYRLAMINREPSYALYGWWCTVWRAVHQEERGTVDLGGEG